jgi:hypothetical protein
MEGGNQLDNNYGWTSLTPSKRWKLKVIKQSSL